MGRLNPISPPLTLMKVGDRAVGHVNLGSVYQGAPGLVHGAVISALYDEVLALANLIHGKPGPTARLTIHFRAPTPLNQDLRFEAHSTPGEGRRIVSRGTCHAGGTLLTEAEGLFIQIV
jgi:acyl-coenzyme A thioesterase PaaI-like protein